MPIALFIIIAAVIFTVTSAKRRQRAAEAAKQAEARNADLKETAASDIPPLRFSTDPVTAPQRVTVPPAYPPAAESGEGSHTPLAPSQEGAWSRESEWIRERTQERPHRRPSPEDPDPCREVAETGANPLRPTVVGTEPVSPRAVRRRPDRTALRRSIILGEVLSARGGRKHVS